MKEPVPIDLTIRKGEGFRRAFAWKQTTAVGAPVVPVDLSSGWRARSQIRVNGQRVLTFDSSASSPRDGTIVLGADGSIVMGADAPTIARTPTGAGAWSVEMIPLGADPVTLIEGRVVVLEEITELAA